jgi:hypothetical protein
VRRLFALAVLAGLAACAASGEDPPAPPRVELGQGGITFPAWWYDEYTSAFSDKALGQIPGTGAGWVTLVSTWYQSTPGATDIRPERDGRTPSDASLRHAVEIAHERGLEVMLKPHVDLRDDSLDRATIRPRDRESWFASYTRFIVHYAEIAESTGVEQLSVGTELTGTSRDAQRWREVIRSVRDEYHGPLTYAANYDEYQQVRFWDSLDLIGIDAYWPLADGPTADVAALEAAWADMASELAAASRRWDRPVLFTEAGYASQRGAVTAPYDWTQSAIADEREQAAAYEALLRTFWGRPWFAGVHWWMWDDFPGGDEDQSVDYTPRGKSAEQVLRRWWRPSSEAR